LANVHLNIGNVQMMIRRTEPAQCDPYTLHRTRLSDMTSPFDSLRSYPTWLFPFTPAPFLNPKKIQFHSHRLGYTVVDPREKLLLSPIYFSLVLSNNHNKKRQFRRRRILEFTGSRRTRIHYRVPTRLRH